MWLVVGISEEKKRFAIVYHIMRKFGEGKVWQFGKLSVICQTQISTYY